MATLREYFKIDFSNALQVHISCKTLDSDIEIPVTIGYEIYSKSKFIAYFGLMITVRDNDYLQRKMELEKPLAFICHDSRDKDKIAQPLAIKLQSFMCPVWYDEFSLKIGDSLRESVERGIHEAKYCVLILTPNFLSNNGWSKEEFNAIFTKDLVQGKKTILPIWHDVTKEQVANYSLILADRLAAKWDDGIDVVSRKLLSVLLTKN